MFLCIGTCDYRSSSASSPAFIVYTCVPLYTLQFLENARLFYSSVSYKSLSSGELLVAFKRPNRNETIFMNFFPAYTPSLGSQIPCLHLMLTFMSCCDCVCLCYLLSEQESFFFIFVFLVPSPWQKLN